MKEEHLLYLKLKLEHKEDFLDLQLQKRGFQLLNKTGTGLEQFRNYYYSLPDAPEACEVHFKLVPGKNTTNTITISLMPAITNDQVTAVFERMKAFAKSIPLDLLDLKLRNRFYQQLFEQGVVNAYYVGLNEEEQLEVEKKAYIPIDAILFLQRVRTPELVAEDGQRAPDLDKR